MSTRGAARAAGNNPPAAAAGNPPGLAEAIMALLTHLQNQNQAQQNLPPPPQGPAPVLDPFTSTLPFDLASRAGATAYSKASEALEEKWDGSTEQFPIFVVALRNRATEVKWDAPAPQGILTVAGKQLLDEFQSISDAEVEAARLARLDPRAQQNAKAMYHCLKKSVTGNLYAQVFEQVGNVPIHEDGVTLFKQLTTFTLGASLQLSILAMQQLTTFDPAQHAYSIPAINTKVGRLFMLTRTSARVISDPEKLQLVLTIYARILQPEAWAQWVRTQMEKFEDGTLTNPNALMNSAALKYATITANQGGQFNGSVNSIRDDIVAMYSQQMKRKSKDLKSDSDKSKKGKKTGAPTRELPPFATHTKVSLQPNAASYKVGDTKVHDKVTYHFCDCPNHRGRVHWHTHPPSECRTRERWLSEKKHEKGTDANAHVADNAAMDTPPPQEGDKDDGGATDITGALADLYNREDLPANLKDMVGNALSSLHQE